MKRRLGPRIQAAKRKSLLNPAMVSIGPLMNSPMSSPLFMKLMRMEN